MLKIYCVKCGNPTVYSLSKPKFCSSCGESFNNNFIKNTATVENPKVELKNIRPEIDFDDEDYADNITSVPKISHLNYEIDSISDKKIKIGDIIGTEEKQNKQKNKSKKFSKLDRKKFLEEFRKEAGAIKPKLRDKKNG